MQYQLAYGTWYNLHTRFLLLAMILAVFAFFSENPLYLAFIVLIYLYAFFRLYQIFNMKDEKFHQRLEKQLKYYERQNQKSPNEYAFQLEKIVLEVEMKRLSVEQAITKIHKIMKNHPKMAKGAQGVLLSIYLVGKEEGSIQDIPQQLIDYLEQAWKKEDSPNALLDYVRMALKLEKYDLTLDILEKTQEENIPYKRIRSPIARSIYKAVEVSILYYRALAYSGKGEKEQGKVQMERAIKFSKSRKLREQMQQEGKNLGIL